MKKYTLLLPTFGILVFVVLYLWAASVYIGGTPEKDLSDGFSILNNYWCDLFAAGKDGNNPSRPIALIAMTILCLSLCIFWYFLPRLFTPKKTNNSSFLKLHIHQWISILGIAGMLTLLFLSTSYHNAVINIAGFLANTALALTFVELWRYQLNRLLGFGLVLLVLAGLNYTIYQTGHWLFALPLLQKISFAYGLWWLVWVNIRMYKKTI